MACHNEALKRNIVKSRRYIVTCKCISFFSERWMETLNRLQLLSIEMFVFMKYLHSFTHPMPPALLPCRFCTRMSLICPINSSRLNQSSSHSCPAIWIKQRVARFMKLRSRDSVGFLSYKVLYVAGGHECSLWGFQGSGSEEMLGFGSRIVQVKLLCFLVTHMKVSPAQLGGKWERKVRGKSTWLMLAGFSVHAHTTSDTLRTGLSLARAWFVNESLIWTESFSVDSIGKAKTKTEVHYRSRLWY